MNKYIKKYNGLDNNYDREKYYSQLELKFEELDNKLFELSMIQSPTQKDKMNIKKVEGKIAKINVFFRMV